MKLISLIVPLVATALLSACTTMRPGMSYVAPGLNKQDAATIAADTVAHLAQNLQPAKTTIILDPQQRTDVLTVAMQETLIARGFGVVRRNSAQMQEIEQGTPLRYISTPLEYGYALRVQYNNTEATRYYPRTTAGDITAVAPFVIRELKQ